MRRVGAVLLANAGLTSAAHPIRMIVTTLKEMQAQLAADATDDKKLYDRMQCWCKKTMPQLNESVAKNEDTAKAESAASAAASAAAKKLGEEIATLTEKIDMESKALADANAQRSKDSDSFNALQAELTQTISANQQALEVLSKHLQAKQTGVQGPVETGFLQSKPTKTMLITVASTIKSSMQRLMSSDRVQISPSQRSAIAGFLQQPTFGAYQSASGEIIGILQSMLEEFERDLSDETKTEEAAAEAHAKMVQIKEKLIADFQKQVQKKTNQKQASEKKAKESSAIAEEASAAAEADAASLAATTADCQTNVKDYAQRSADRTNEQTAVQTAIDYLDSDEARDLFRDTAATFLQIHQKTVSSDASRREKARSVLQAAGMKVHSAKLLVLAQTVLRGGVFDKIILAINELEKELVATKASDQAEFDSCTGSINERKTKVSSLKSEITGEEETIQNAADAIQRLTDEIAAKEEEISQLETELKDAGYLREQASQKFTVDYANNEAAVKLLNKTIAALGEAYPASLIEQAPGRADTMEQPDDFKEYKKNASGNTVVTALEKIKNDINKSMEDAIAQESSENEAYGNTVQTYNTQITGCKDQKTQMKADLVDEERIHQSTTESKEAHEAELKSEEDALKAKEKSCKFIMENLDIRKTHMDTEIKALQQAREFLKDQVTQTA